MLFPNLELEIRRPAEMTEEDTLYFERFKSEAMRRVGSELASLFGALHNLDPAHVALAEMARIKPFRHNQVRANLKNYDKATMDKLKGLLDTGYQAIESAFLAFMLPSAEEQAERVLHKHVTLLRDFLGDDDPGTLNAINIHGLLLADRGEYNKAETLLHEVLQTRRETLGDDHGDTRISLGRVVELRKARVQAKKRERAAAREREAEAAAATKWRSKWQWALQRVLREEREHKRKTAENAAESEERRRVRARAEEAKQSKAEKPLSLPGPSGPAPKTAWAEETPGASARAKRKGKKAIAREAIEEHKQHLEEKEVLRKAQLEERNEALRKSRELGGH